MTDDLVIKAGTVSIAPVFCPYPHPGLIDFEIKSSNGHHQVISVNEDIVSNRSQIGGRIRVFGKLSSKDGDSVIVARRIEFI